MTTAETGGRIQVAAMSLLWDRPTGPAFEGMLDDIAGLGYDGLSCFATDLAPYLDQPRELAHQLNARGLALAAVTALLDDDPTVVRLVMRCMSILGAPHLACTDFDTGLDIAEAAAILNSRGADGARHGVKVYYHNHTGGVAQTAEELVALRRRCDPNLVGSMLDVGHATKDFLGARIEDRAATFVETHMPPISYLELKDWSPRTDLNTPLGEGVTDFDRIVAAMRNASYSGWVTVEQNGNDGLSLGRSPWQCAQISRDFLRNRFNI